MNFFQAGDFSGGIGNTGMTQPANWARPRVAPLGPEGQTPSRRFREILGIKAWVEGRFFWFRV